MVRIGSVGINVNNSKYANQNSQRVQNMSKQISFCGGENLKSGNNINPIVKYAGIGLGLTALATLGVVLHNKTMMSKALNLVNNGIIKTEDVVSGKIYNCRVPGCVSSEYYWLKDYIDLPAAEKFLKAAKERGARITSDVIFKRRRIIQAEYPSGTIVTNAYRPEWDKTKASRYFNPSSLLYQIEKRHGLLKRFKDCGGLQAQEIITPKMKISRQFGRLPSESTIRIEFSDGTGRVKGYGDKNFRTLTVEEMRTALRNWGTDLSKMLETQ